MPRDSFAWLSDGLSNQLMLGEKHIPNGRLGISRNGNIAPTADNRNWTADVTYIIGSRWGMQGCARNILSRAPNLARPDEYTADGYQAINGTPAPVAGYKWKGLSTGNALNGSYDFGGPHPGTCNFLIGDGSVRGISVTVPKEDLLAHLVHVSDGESVSLP